MKIKYFSNSLLQSLVEDALLSPRKRVSHNIHINYADVCQRLFNAIGVDSYIPPHRHSLDPKDECLIAIKGLFVLIIFNDYGSIIDVKKFGSELYSGACDEWGVGVEIPAMAWHTVMALNSSSILFEIKAGPFSLLSAKEYAPWAPDESSIDALNYFQALRDQVGVWMAK